MSEENDLDHEEEGSEEEGSEEEGSEEEELRQSVEEDFNAEEGSETEPEAVALPEVLRQVLDRFCDERGKPFAEGHARYQEFTKGKLWEATTSKLAEFCNDLLDAMVALPPSPGRRMLSVEEEKALRAQFRPVWQSFKSGKALLGILCNAGYARTGKRRSPSKMIARYISAVEGQFDDGTLCKPYAIYKALDSWLFRRTDAYRKWAKTYYRRPDVRARKAKNRPDKKAEAERKWRAYYAAKGILEPPPKRVKAATVGAANGVADDQSPAAPSGERSETGTDNASEVFAKM